jgi:hypothetical protein
MPCTFNIPQYGLVPVQVCAAALQQLQPSPNDSTMDDSYEEKTTTDCYTAQACDPTLGSSNLQMSISISLPYHTCAVVQQTLVNQILDKPQLLLLPETQLAEAAIAATHIPTLDSRLTSIQEAIQNSKNVIFRAISISAEDAEYLRMFGGSEEDASEELDEWMWDPYREAYNLDLSSTYGIWIAAVSTFGVGMLLVSMMLLHRGITALARRQAEQQLIRHARQHAAEAAAEAAGDACGAQSEGSSAGLLQPAAV